MSASKLLPCPFCGGEAELHPSYDMDTSEVDGWFVWCNNKECECAPETREHFTEAEAIEAWNTRAEMSYEDIAILLDELGLSERTCKFVSSKGSDYPPVCSACGYELGIYDCAWYEDGTYGYERNYCPNCGAKVVS